MSYVSNPCTRCGKERILLKKWTEKIPGYGNNIMTVVRSLNVCPDPDCQALVDKELAEAQRKRDKQKSDRDEQTEKRKNEKLEKTEIKV